MGILVFVCPTTGHEVFNRRRNRQIQLQKTLEDEEGGLLSALSQEPYARRDEVPKLRMKVDPRSLLRRWFIPKRSSPILEPCRSRGAMLWRGTPLA